jgi:hypothetical protein
MFRWLGDDIVKVEGSNGLFSPQYVQSNFNNELNQQICLKAVNVIKSLHK